MLAATPILAGLGLAAGGVAHLVTDEGLKRVENLLEGLRRLTPEERATLLKLSRKMTGEAENNAAGSDV